jgi:hypothetical protein
MDYWKPEEDCLVLNDPSWLVVYVPPALELFTHCNYLFYSTSIHEASHAVLNEHFGYRLKFVEAKGKTGVTEIEPTKQDPEHIVIIAHAAYVAALQVINKQCAYQDANDDRLLITQVCDREKLPGKRAIELYRKSEELVEKNWRQIEAVANALADKKLLTGDEVREIITRSAS